MPSIPTLKGVQGKWINHCGFKGSLVYRSCSRTVKTRLHRKTLPKKQTIKKPLLVKCDYPLFNDVGIIFLKKRKTRSIIWRRDFKR